MGDQIQPNIPAGTFIMSAKTISQTGQCLLTVVKDENLDKGGNPYVSIQVPTDFAAYLLMLQEMERSENDVLDQAMNNYKPQE